MKMRSPAGTGRLRAVIPGGLALVALAVFGCGQRDRSPEPGAQSSTGTGTGPGTDTGAAPAEPSTSSGPAAAGSGAASAACVSPAIADPPACPLARSAAASASFSPDERTAVVAVVQETEDGLVGGAEVWDVRRGRVVATLAKDLEHHGSLQAAWTQDGSRVAIAGIGDSHFGYRIYDTDGFRPLHEDPDIRSSFPCAVEIDPAGKRVAMTTLLGTAAIHDLASGRLLVSLKTTEMRAAGHVCSALQWSGDGKAIDMEGLRESRGLRPVPRKPVREEDLVQFSFAPKGDMAATLDRKGDVRVFKNNGTVPFKVLAAGRGVPPVPDPDSAPVIAFSWRPDAAAIATWDRTGKIRVWDPVKGTLSKELRASGPPLPGPPDPEVEDARLVWAPDGRAFAFWSGDRPELWSLDDGRQKLQNREPPKFDSPAIPSVEFSPDGSLLATHRYLWDTRTGYVVRWLPGHLEHWLDSGRLVAVTDHPATSPLRVVRLSDGAVLVLERLGDGASPTLLAHTEDGVFQGAREHAGCALPATGARRGLAPEPRDTLLADFWAGRAVARTCP